MPKILVIDDNQPILNFLKIFLIQSGDFQVETLQDSTKAYNLLEQQEFDILILDMDMPSVTGLDILKFIKQNDLKVITIVLTGVEDIDLAISAMKLGTHDYLLKPIDEKKLMEAIENALSNIRLNSPEESSTTFSYNTLKNKELFKNIVTQDVKMIKIFHFVEKFAITDNSVLIWGESGTGKELIAKAIHQISTRNKNDFVAVNAGLFAHELFSSEFFGHEKGAFTGAIKDKKGFIEEANGGTLFLDEIGELDLLTQVKLLRVLQEQEFYRMGSTKNIKVDVRIIAATNKNLFDEINNGNFRKDLFFRLNINSIELPPLREREGDIELLADYYLQKYNKKYNKSIKSIAPSVMNLLKAYSFPGNARELMNIINSAVTVESSHELKRNSLPNYLKEHLPQIQDFEPEFIAQTLEEVEKNHIIKVLELTGNNKTKAADILGISRINLIAKVKKYQLEKQL
jgi:DNA-binding NtrC family response regulator